MSAANDQAISLDSDFVIVSRFTQREANKILMIINVDLVKMEDCLILLVVFFTLFLYIG
jgi:hypothetical protein